MKRGFRMACAVAGVMGLGISGGAMRAQAVVPPAVNYQGRLVDGTNLVQGSHAIRFRLFASPVSTNVLLQETDVVLVIDGLYSTTLGNGPLAAGAITSGPPAQPLYGSMVNALENETNLFLEVSVDGVAMSPRERLLAVPYALAAGRAETVASGAITTDALAAGLRNSLDASGGGISNAVYVDASGHVGLGTTTPGAALDIRGGTGVLTPEEMWARGDGMSGATNLDGACAVYASSNFAYVAASVDNAITILNVSNLASVSVVTSLVDGVGGYSALGGVDALAKLGNFLFAGSYADDAVTIINVSNPANPVRITELQDGSGGYSGLNGVYGLTVAGHYLYVAGMLDSALTIVDVSNPLSPSLRSQTADGTGAFTNLGGACSVAVTGVVACVAGFYDSAISILSVSTPASPTLLACLRDGVDGYTGLYGVCSVAIAGSYLYAVSYDDSTLTIVDIATPSAPVLVRQIVDGEEGFDLLSGAIWVRADGNRLYIASLTDDAVTVADISDPAAPRVIATMRDNFDGSYLGGANCAFNEGSTLYVAAKYDDACSIWRLDPAATNGPASIVADGRVGIGTSAPTEALDVRGNATISGSLKVGGEVSLFTYATSQGGRLGVSSDGHLSVSTSHTKNYAYPACAFRPVTDNLGANNFYNREYAYMTGGTNELCAPVDLPDDDSIYYVYIRYADLDASNDLRVRLVRRTSISNASTNIVDWSSSGLGTGLSQQNIDTNSMTDTSIDNYSFNYYLYVHPASGSTWSSSMRLYNVTIRCYGTEF